MKEVQRYQSVTEIEVVDVEDYISFIFSKFKDVPNKKYMFRGHAEASWMLVPTAQRSLVKNISLSAPISECDLKKVRDREINLLETFQQRALPYVEQPPDRNNAWEWLAIGQHHGLPTRFLDWTFHAATALYFAVEKPEINNDYCAIWCSEVFSSSASGMDSNPFDIPEVFPLYPSHITKRIMLQNGCFTVHPTDYLTKMYMWPLRLEKILFPKSKRAITKNLLRKLGINRSSIFGDLDSVAADISGEM